MNWFWKRLRIFFSLIDALQQGPETVDYPAGPLSLPEGYRGEIVMADASLCSGCGLCVRDCPAQALELTKHSRTQYRLVHYPARCAYCGQCEDNCRRGAISHTRSLIEATDNPNRVVVLKEENEDEKGEA
jgi:NAD(P)H-quinone oxidoreductase subunit I